MQPIDCSNSSSSVSNTDGDNVGAGNSNNNNAGESNAVGSNTGESNRQLGNIVGSNTGDGNTGGGNPDGGSGRKKIPEPSTSCIYAPCGFEFLVQEARPSCIGHF
ncbi:MAG: hypothetical protein F6J93_16575 [Oscillatoria sp. SIO1A7]|nr:hypothetical protein [Oscillatoria sp. SIO1A7]